MGMSKNWMNQISKAGRKLKKTRVEKASCMRETYIERAKEAYTQLKREDCLYATSLISTILTNLFLAHASPARIGTSRKELSSLSREAQRRSHAVRVRDFRNGLLSSIKSEFFLYCRISEKMWQIELHRKNEGVLWSEVGFARCRTLMSVGQKLWAMAGVFDKVKRAREVAMSARATVSILHTYHKANRPAAREGVRESIAQCRALAQTASDLLKKHNLTYEDAQIDEAELLKLRHLSTKTLAQLKTPTSP